LRRAPDGVIFAPATPSFPEGAAMPNAIGENLAFRAALLSLLLAAGGAGAQQPPPEAEPPTGRVFCEQDVAYHIADRGSIPDGYRRFLGIWSDAAWSARTCAALIVENIAADGTASIIYAFGPLGPADSVPGGVLHGTGIIREGELKFQNSDGSQFVFRPGIVDLVGHLTTPKGENYEATFKKTR
jgi:hypothetical protein